MLKRNLIVIAFIIFGLSATNNAFGQDREAGSGLATGVRATENSNRKATIKKPTSIAAKKPKQIQPGNSGGTISNQRTSRKPKPAGLLAAGELLIHAVKGENNAPSSTGDQPELQRKKTRTRSTQKRQHKP